MEIKNYDAPEIPETPKKRDGTVPDRDNKDKFNKNVGELLTEFEGSFEIRETSRLGLKPGDIIIFNYVGSPRMGLVVSSKRTATGLFLSTRMNVLMNVFLIDSLTPSMFKMVVNNLYNQEIRCTYRNAPKILASFLKKENFRTFNSSPTMATDIKKINIINQNTVN